MIGIPLLIVAGLGFFGVIALIVYAAKRGKPPVPPERDPRRRG
jgi:hypothetical protein